MKDDPCATHSALPLGRIAALLPVFAFAEPWSVVHAATQAAATSQREMASGSSPGSSGDGPGTESERQARESYFDALEHRGRPQGNWPFDGFVEAPPSFPRGSQPTPIATVEWRQRDGRLHESHVAGTPDGLGICRALRPTLAGGERDSAEDWVPPGPDMGRGAWSTAFVDCYELAEDGPWITVTHRGDRHTIEAHLIGFDDLGTAVRSAGEPVASWCVEQINAMQGPVFECGDFDGNGSLDFLLGSYQVSLGLAFNQQTGWLVLTDADEGRARIEPIDTIGTNLVDLDADGKAEILITSFGGTTCLDDRPHNFYITQCLGIDDLRLVDLRGTHRVRSEDFTGDFPSFEWLAFNPESRFKPLLSPEMKEGLIRKRYPTPTEVGAPTTVESSRPPRVIRTFSTGHAWREIDKIHETDEGLSFPGISLQLVDAEGHQVVVHDLIRGYSAQCGVDLDPLQPEDIDGDGLVETVVGVWSSGTQCFSDYTIYRLKIDGSIEILAERTGACRARFTDVDHDGSLDIEETIRLRYVFGPGAHSNPLARTVHRLESGRWVADVGSMRTAPPPPALLEAYVQQIRSRDWSATPPDEDGILITTATGRMWEIMVPLVYQGHAAAAIKVFQDAWPEEIPGADRNLAFFVERLRRATPFWTELMRIQDPPVDWTTILAD